MARVEQRAFSSVQGTAAEPLPVTLEGVRVSWGGVWSGFLFGIGILLLFSALGLAIGISTADLGRGQGLDASGFGVGAAIWSAVSLLVALFIGGMVATRIGMVFDRTAGMVQGALVWVLAILGIIYLASSGISLLATGAFSLIRGVTGQVGAVVQGATQVDDLLSGDVNQILARLNDPQTAKTVAAATGTSQQEAAARLADIRARVEAAKDNPAQAAAQARQGLQELLAQTGQRAERAAAAAQPYASATLWTTLGILVLSLLAAVGGASVGSNRAAARVGVR